MFNVTMQNHSPYDLFLPEKYDTVRLEGRAKGFEKAEQYLSLVRQTDRALGDLISYFEKQERPVILLFFGDHQPFIEDDFYEAVSGGQDDEEAELHRYATRFLMWANYDIPKGWIDRISMNYLSTLLLENTGLDMPAYNRYLGGLYEEVPVVTSQGCIGTDGKAEGPAEGIDSLRDYERIVYNDLIDTENRADVF